MRNDALSSHQRVQRDTRGPEIGIPQSPASVYSSKATSPTPAKGLRGAVVLTIRSDERTAQRETVETFALRNRHHLGDEVLVGASRDVERQRGEAAIPASIGPAIGFHQQRI